MEDAMAKKIEPMTIELSAEEVLGLRYIHSHWLGRDRGNAPFCEAMSDQFLEKLGGYLRADEPLWDHPIAARWYAEQVECNQCGRSFHPAGDSAPDEENICQDCKGSES
jgi:hypothetical protein